MRTLSTDVPTRLPMHRRGRIKARINVNTYIVDCAGANGSVHAAFFPGGGLLVLGSDVTLEFDPTIPGWWIL
jgi:hypothetical protein